MLCKYSYLTKNKKEVGEFQADTEDLKQIFKHNPDIECGFVTLENGEEWILYKKYGWRWEIVKRQQ